MEKPIKKKKSIFKRWWFWVIIIFVFIATTGEKTNEEVFEETNPPAVVEAETEKEPLERTPVILENEPATEQEPTAEPEPAPEVELEPAPVAKPEQPSAQTSSIFGSVNSDKYHNRVCTTWTQKILDAGNAVYFESEADAEAHGYQPCSKCYGG